MKVFLIFDNSSFSFNSFRKESRQVEVFPLIADWKDINLVINELNCLGHVTKLLPSAEMIYNEASCHRSRFIEWAALLGNISVKSRSLREWFLLSDKGISAWWFSLLADKDPAKSNVFLRMIQTNSILKACNQSNSDVVVLAVKDKQFRRTLKDTFENRGINCSCINPKLNFSAFFTSVGRWINNRRVAKAIYHLCKISVKVIQLKMTLGTLKNRTMNFDDSLLFFTYFPSVAKEDAKEGRFKNKLALPLQELCQHNNKNVVWIAMHAKLDDYSFKDAVLLGKRLIQRGDNLYFYQEFLSMQSILRVFVRYLKVVATWCYIRRKLRSEMIKDICNEYSTDLFLNTMDDSFFGFSMIYGMIQYEAYKNIFKNFSGISHGVYYCEMMAWEYALNAAKRYCKSEYPLIAYQHAAISLNYLHMFHSKLELKEQNTLSGIPMPEVIASSGPFPQQMLSMYYDRVENFEALRYLYIRGYLEQKKMPLNKDRNFLLMGFTNIYNDESKALVSLISSSFPDKEDGLEIWFKGHPSLPVPKIFEEADIPLKPHCYEIKEGSVPDFLSQCNAVLVGASTVAVEALAFGCEVMVYVNAETLNQSPLIGYDELFHKVYDPENMQTLMKKLCSNKGYGDPDKKTKFVKEFWNLNPSLDEWRRALGIV